MNSMVPQHKIQKMK